MRNNGVLVEVCARSRHIGASWSLSLSSLSLLPSFSRILWATIVMMTTRNNVMVLADGAGGSTGGTAGSSASGDPADPDEFSRSTQEDDGSRPYVIWEAQLIAETVLRWGEMYPDLVRVDTAQNAYGLDRAGGSSDCPYDEDGDGCNNWFVTIQDYITHPEGSESSNALPEVLWSGALHGNERVGPTAVMEAGNLLLLAASCEAKPHIYDDDEDNSERLGHSLQSDSRSKAKEMEKARICRKELAQSGINDTHRKWLARIVATRRIVVVPTANALGYYRDKREEERIDPNRDFPYDVTDPKDCMQSIAGRTLNEIFQEHMFQLSLTFHGGMEVIAYEWGAPHWMGSISPDHLAQADIASAYSHYGGGFKTSNPYSVGTLNDLVYPVRGGMEDWAYAASWDPERVVQCKPTTYSSYPLSKTIYNNATLRVFNMLVETSNHKTPSLKTLGSSLDVMSFNTVGNGHISRNIRLALLAADVVEPYVTMLGVDDLPISDDVVPMVHHRNDRPKCQTIKTVMVPQPSTKAQKKIMVEWTVGGAFTIDKTTVWFAKWEDIPEQHKVDCLMQPSPKTVRTLFTSNQTAIFHQAEIQGPSSGTGYFHAQKGPSPLPAAGSVRTLGPIFQAAIDLSKIQNIKPSDKIIVMASAIVDQNWIQTPPKTHGQDYNPHIAPQSHVANVRTNPDWIFQSNNKTIQGRKEWFSMPLTIIFGHYQDTIGMQLERSVGTIEVSNRFGDTSGGYIGGVTPNVNISHDQSYSFISSTKTEKTITSYIFSAGFAITFLISMSLFVTMFILMRRRTSSRRQKPGHQLVPYEDDDEFDDEDDNYHDDVVVDDDDDYDDGYNDYCDDEEQEKGLRRTNRSNKNTTTTNQSDSQSKQQSSKQKSEVELKTFAS